MLPAPSQRLALVRLSRSLSRSARGHRTSVASSSPSHHAAHHKRNFVTILNPRAPRIEKIRKQSMVDIESVQAREPEKVVSLRRALEDATEKREPSSSKDAQESVAVAAQKAAEEAAAANQLSLL